MTINQTIYGVSRDLIEHAIEALTRHLDQHAPMQVPPSKADSDLVREELRALLDSPYPSEAQMIASGLGYPMSKEDAVKAYKASLVPRTDSSSNADCEWCHGCGHDPYGEPCVGCCTPGAPPHGDPVERQPDAIIEGVMTSVGISHAIYASTVSLKHGEQVKLYAEQPAPVAVALPERLDLPHRDEFESADQYAAAIGEAKKWNACLDELKLLNPSL